MPVLILKVNNSLIVIYQEIADGAKPNRSNQKLFITNLIIFNRLSVKADVAGGRARPDSSLAIKLGEDLMIWVSKNYVIFVILTTVISSSPTSHESIVTLL